MTDSEASWSSVEAQPDTQGPLTLKASKHGQRESVLIYKLAHACFQHHGEYIPPPMQQQGNKQRTNDVCTIPVSLMGCFLVFGFFPHNEHIDIRAARYHQLFVYEKWLSGDTTLGGVKRNHYHGGARNCSRLRYVFEKWV